MRIWESARDLKHIQPDVAYYAATLRDSHGKLDRSFYSHFADFPEGVGPGRGVEVRETSPVDPAEMTQMWDDVGHDWMIVNQSAQLFAFVRLGGNALITQDFARQHFADLMGPKRSISKGAGGFLRHRPDAPDLQERSRTRQKKRIRERDGHQCQECGAQPSDDGQTELEVHHIRPFSDGGPTVDENLITLCKQCHDELDPHYQPDLHFTAGPLTSAADSESAETHRRGVEAYRRRIAQMLDASANRD